MTDTKPTTVAAVLDAAADLLVQRGWIQGDFERTYLDDDLKLKRGGCCAAGAIHYVRTGEAAEDEDDWLAIEAKEALVSELGHEPSEHLDPVEAIGNWNDAAESADEVIATLRRVAQQHRDATRAGA